MQGKAVIKHGFLLKIRRLSISTVQILFTQVFTGKVALTELIIIAGQILFIIKNTKCAAMVMPIL